MRWLLGFVLGAGVAAALLTSLHADTSPTFVWPWAGDEGWRYTQGPHIDYALDFQPQIEPNCDHPIDSSHVIRPVAPGTVIAVGVRGEPSPPLPVSVTIDHGDGWTSYYTHLANVPPTIFVGEEVGYESDLGNPSCLGTCTSESGLCANGRHVHFQILRDGSGAGILDVAICGWTVDAAGGISRDGATYLPDLSGPAPIANVDCPAGKPAALTPAPSGSPTLAPDGTATPTATATPTRVRVAGDVSCDGVTTVVDAAMLLQANAGVATLACAENGDVTGDGRSDTVDAQVILQYVAGLVDI